MKRTARQRASFEVCAVRFNALSLENKCIIEILLTLHKASGALVPMITPQPRSLEYVRMAQADEHTLRHLASYLKAAGDTARLQRLLVGTRNWLDVKAERFGTDTEY